MKRSVIFGTVLASALGAVGCGGDSARTLNPQAMALTSNVKPFYDDGELKLYETQIPINLPISKPNATELAALSGKVGPFSRHPWVTADQVQVQLTWTLANLDAPAKGAALDSADHAIEVLVDPWNEFGRYSPGIEIQGDNSVPDLSGIDEIFDLPGLDSGRSSRIEQTYTYDDMNEMATDFATAINILTTVKPTPAAPDGTTTDPRVGLVNHVFDVHNRHGSDPFTDSYTPSVIPGLVGFNLGLRSEEPANVAIEFTLELIDSTGDKVLDEGSTTATLVAPSHIYSLTAK